MSASGHHHDLNRRQQVASYSSPCTYLNAILRYASRTSAEHAVRFSPSTAHGHRVDPLILPVHTLTRVKLQSSPFENLRLPFFHTPAACIALRIAAAPLTHACTCVGHVFPLASAVAPSRERCGTKDSPGANAKAQKNHLKIRPLTDSRLPFAPYSPVTTSTVQCHFSSCSALLRLLGMTEWSPGHSHHRQFVPRHISHAPSTVGVTKRSPKPCQLHLRYTHSLLCHPIHQPSSSPLCSTGPVDVQTHHLPLTHSSVIPTYLALCKRDAFSVCLRIAAIHHPSPSSFSLTLVTHLRITSSTFFACLAVPSSNTNTPPYLIHLPPDLPFPLLHRHRSPLGNSTAAVSPRPFQFPHQPFFLLSNPRNSPPRSRCQTQ